jgi:hypothetical protein
MPGERSFALREADQVRGAPNAISDNLDALKVQVARPPPRAHVSRLALTLGASMWALIGFVAWLLAG